MIKQINVAIRLSAVRSVTILVVGTIVAQGLAIITSPILSRLYSPDDFGGFAVFMSVTSILSVMASGRYEYAILLPHDDIDAFRLLLLASGLSALTGGIVFIVMSEFGTSLLPLSKTMTLQTWIYSLPIMVGSLSLFQAFTYWFNRMKQYQTIARGKIVRSVFTVLVSVVVGIRYGLGEGLVIGAAVGQVLGMVSYLLSFKIDKNYGRELRANLGVLSVAKRYSHFPRIAVIGDSINSFSSQMPILILSSFFGATVTGYYALTQRVLAAPSVLVATAIGEVYVQHASKSLRENGNCRETWLMTFRALSLISLPLFFSIFILSRWLFVVAFGPEWYMSGVYAQMMIPLFALSFVASVLGRTTTVTEKLMEDMFWQIALFILVLLSLLVGVWFNNSIYSIILYTVAYCTMYFIYLWMSYKYSSG